MKNKIYTLIISCLLMSACTESLVTPAVDEQHATLVSLSPTALLPTATVPPAVLATPTETPFLLATSVPRHKDAISSQNIEQVSLLSRLGKGMVEDIAYAPDGKTLAIVTTLGVYLYDAQELSEVASFPSAGDISTYQVAFNRQGDLFALGELQGTDVCNLVLWRFLDGKWQQVGQVEAFVECLAQALSPDGEYLASVNYDNRLATVWRTSDLTLLRTFPLEYPGDIFSIFVQLAFSGENTLAIGEESFVSVYDLRNGILLHRLQKPGITFINRLAISQDGQILAVSDGASQKIDVWHLSSGTSFTIQDQPEDNLTGWMTLSSDGAFIAFGHDGDGSSSPGGWVNLWRTSDGVELARLAKPEWYSSPNMAFTPDSSKLVTWLNGVDFWEASDGELSDSLSEFARVDGILSPDGTLLAVVTSQQIQLYRLVEGKIVHILEEGDNSQNAVFFSPDSNLLASKRIPGRIQLWDVDDGALKISLEFNCSTPSSMVNDVRFSPDGQYLAVYAYSPRCRGIAVWQVSDGKRLYEFDGSGGDSFSISPDGNILIVEDESAGTISLVQIRDGRTIQTIKSPKVDEFGELLSVFSPNSQFYAIGKTNGAIEVWQIGMDAPLYTLTSLFEWNALSFSPDSKSLVTESDHIQVWNASDGTLRYSLKGQFPTYREVLFSPDGTMIVTFIPGERVVQLWGAGDGTLLHSLNALPPALFSPDGKILVTSGEGMIQLWSVGDGALLRTLAGTTLPVAFSSDGRLLISMRDGVVETWGVPVP